MNFFVRYIVDRMSFFDLVNEDEQEYYNYYLELILEKIIALSTIFIMALCMDRVVETLLFIATFSSIRKYAGGYHCNSFYGCYLLSMSVCFVCISPFFVDRLNVSKVSLFIFTLLSICVILAIGAVNHPNMDWDEVEQHNSKNNARSMAVLLGGIVISFCYLSIFQDYVFYIAEGIWVSALSMLVAKVLSQEVKL